MRDFSEKKKRPAERKARKKGKRSLPIAALARKAGRVLALVSGVAVSLAALYVGWQQLTASPYLRISHVRVEGNRQVKEEELVGLTEARGANIITFDVEDAGRRVESLPWVREVSLARELPGSVKIRVSEREPLAMINLGELYYIDDEGVIFAAADGNTGVNYPVLSGLDRGKLLRGERESFELLERGLELLRILKTRKGSLAWDDVSELFLDLEEGMTLYTSERGIPVHLGKGGFEEKLYRAERVIYDLNRKGIKSRRLEADYDDRVLVKVAI